MELTDIFRNKKNNLDSLQRERRPSPEQKEVTCASCGGVFPLLFMRRHFGICPDCGYYLPMTPKGRIRMIAEEDSFRPLFTEITTTDPIHFPGYEEKLEKSRSLSGEKDAVVTGTCRIRGMPTAVAVLDTRFLMGSMGTVVGEKITLLTEYAMQKKLPLLIFSASGGARMQEGIFSLMQMAKTSAAIERFQKAGGFYISVLCNPTTGGVSASFAFLGDIILAEPGALIGFAGPRVIRQTIGQELPEGFQSAQSQLENGMIDRLVDRRELEYTIYQLLRKNMRSGKRFSVKKNPVKKDPVKKDRGLSEKNGVPLESEKDTSENDALNTAENTVLSPYERVRMARKKDRPGTAEIINHLFDDFCELHGDRLYRDDYSIMGGIAYFHDLPVTVIGHRKGRTTEENLKCNFGMASPEGYRKALRLMKQAEKAGRPVITFVDTPGAYPGIEAENHGQARAIADSLAQMSSLEVPVISVVIGEGGSGGALALAVSDSVWMLENAVYSILSPEGFASILWKDAKRVEEACRVMRLTAQDLMEDGIIDGILEEGKTGDRDILYSRMDLLLCRELEKLTKLDKKARTAGRYERFRKIGQIKTVKLEDKG